MKYFVLVVFVGYASYSAWFCFRLRKTNVFTNNQKRLHYFLIWLIPFVWAIIVKSMITPTPGTAGRHSGEATPFKESEIGILGDNQEPHDATSHHHDSD